MEESKLDWHISIRSMTNNIVENSAVKKKIDKLFKLPDTSCHEGVVSN